MRSHEGGTLSIEVDQQNDLRIRHGQKSEERSSFSESRNVSFGGNLWQKHAVESYIVFIGLQEPYSRQLIVDWERSKKGWLIRTKVLEGN